MISTACNALMRPNTNVFGVNVLRQCKVMQWNAIYIYYVNCDKPYFKLFTLGTKKTMEGTAASVLIQIFAVLSLSLSVGMYSPIILLISRHLKIFIFIISFARFLLILDLANSLVEWKYIHDIFLIVCFFSRFTF